jgi:hypothetical protein
VCASSSPRSDGLLQAAVAPFATLLQLRATVRAADEVQGSRSQPHFVANGLRWKNKAARLA